MYSRHVDADHGPLVVEQEVGQRAGQLGLAHAGRAEEQERADRPVGVGQARTAAADGVGHGGHRVLLADHPLVQDLLHAHELGHLALEQAGDGDAGPLAHDLGHVLGVDLLLQHLLAALQLVEPLGGLGQSPLELGDRCRSGSRRPARGRPPGRPRSGAARAPPSGPGSRRWRPSPPSSGPSWRLTARGGRPARGRGPRAARPSPASVSLASATRSISSWRMRRSTTSISVGMESISMRSRLAASSIRSMALSGRNRPVR